MSDSTHLKDKRICNVHRLHLRLLCRRLLYMARHLESLGPASLDDNRDPYPNVQKPKDTLSQFPECS